MAISGWNRSSEKQEQWYPVTNNRNNKIYNNIHNILKLCNTLVKKAAAYAFSQFSTLVCNSLCQNVVLLQPFHMRKEMKITGSHRKCFKSLFVAAASMQPRIVMKKDNTRGQHSSSLVLNKGIDYSTHSTFGGRLYCFKHVYGLTKHSELTSAMCHDRKAY